MTMPVAKARGAPCSSVVLMTTTDGPSRLKMSATERDDCCAEYALRANDAKTATVLTRPLWEWGISTSRGDLANVAYNRFVARSLQAMITSHGRGCPG